MSMTQALARVGEIRTEIATLQDPATVRAGATAGAVSSTGTVGATDFASALAAVGAGDAQGSSDLVGSLLSSLAGSGTSAGAGSGDLARLFASLTGTSTGTGTPASTGASAAAGTTTGAGSAPSVTPSPSVPVATGSTATGTAGAVLETARQYLGVPYVWGGESLAEGGLDCSGLVQLVFGAHGVDLPRVARDQMRQGTEVASLAQAQPGDLIVQRGGKHIGIYLGDGQMIHAPKPGRTVEITPVTDASVTTIRRVLGAGVPS